MAEARCTPGHHIGEDLGGRCSVCGERLDGPSFWLVLLVLIAVTAMVVLAVGILLSWWLG